MKRLIHYAWPSATSYNRLGAMADTLGKGFVNFAGGSGAPVVNKNLAQEPVYLSSHFAVQDSRRYARIKNSCPYWGVRNATITNAHSRLQALRYDAHLNGAVSVDGYGLVDRMQATIEDYLYSSAPNDMGFWWGDLIPPTVYDKWYEEDWWLGGGSPCIVPPSAGENWYSGGYADPCANTVDAVPGYGDYWTCFEQTGGSFTGTDSPGWITGHSNAQFENWPRAEYSDNVKLWLAPSANWVGSLSIGPYEDTCFVEGTGDGTGWFRWRRQACIKCDGGAAFQFPYRLRRILDGATVNECKLELRIPGLKRYSATVTTTVDAAGTQTTTGTESTNTDAVGVVLLGGRIVDTTYGTWDWDVLATATGAASATAGAWDVYDVTTLAQTLLDSHGGKSRYCRFALMPSTQAALFGQSDTRGLLLSILPDMSIDIFTANNSTAWWNAAVDFEYYPSSSGGYVTWDTIEIGQGFIDVTLPSGAQTRMLLPYGFPVMD